MGRCPRGAVLSYSKRPMTCRNSGSNERHGCGGSVGANTTVLCCLTLRGHYIGAVSRRPVFRSNLSYKLSNRKLTGNVGLKGDGLLMAILRRLWSEDAGQDIAEYAVMLAVILVIVVGTIRLVGSNSNNVFSSVSSSMQ